MLTLRTLGSLDLLGHDGGTLIPILSQPKRHAVLIYLAVARPRGFHRRDTLLSLFWPETAEPKARNALSQSLSFLRQHLPEDTIVHRCIEEVGLNPEALKADVVDFEAAANEGRWSDALELYLGDFLRGFHVKASGFEEWMVEQRSKLRLSAATVAWELAMEQISRGALVEGERTARRALELECADEAHVRKFMKALARAGDRAGAVRFFSRFRNLIQKELELDPSRETQEAADLIRNDSPSATTPLKRDPNFHPVGRDSPPARGPGGDPGQAAPE